jgi:hypothetical protein
MDKDRQHESEIMKYAGSVFRQGIAEAHSPAKVKLSAGDTEAHLWSTDSSHGRIVSHANVKIIIVTWGAFQSRCGCCSTVVRATKDE